MGYIGSDPKTNESVSTAQLVDDSVTNAKIVDNVLFTSVTSSVVSASSTITADSFTGTFSGALSSSAQIGTDISGSFTNLSSSVASDIATNLSSITNNSSSIASDIATNLSSITTLKGSGTTQGVGTSDSPTFNNITATGTVTAQEFHSEFVSASIAFTSGSHKFGDSADDIHQMTGSLRITGSGNHYIQTGNLGIGTNNPGRLLDIENSSAGGSTLVSIVSATDGNCQLLFGDTSSDTRGKVLYNNVGEYMSLEAGGSEIMRISGSGNVGIGTASPQSRLNVFDTFSGTLSTSEGIRFTGAAGDGTNYYNIIENNLSTGAASMGFFISSGDDAVARAMTIQRASVGIGIESPDGTLHVHAGSAGSVAASQYTDTLVVEDSAHGGITILMPDDQEGAISWGNPSDNSAAFLKWVYSSSTMTLGTAKAGSSLVLQSANAATALTLDSSQNASFAGERLKTGEGTNVYQILNGSKTGVAHDTWTTIAYVGHTHVLEVKVWANSGGNRNRMSVFDVMTSYGSNGVNTERETAGYAPDSPSVDNVSLQYNNNGYKIDVKVNVSDSSTSSTVSWAITGMSEISMYNG